MNAFLSIAVAQTNFIVGDMAGNADRIIEAIAKAREAGAELLLTPELALCGYPPEDLLLRAELYRSCEREMARIATHTQGFCVVLGLPLCQGTQHFNAAVVICDGSVIANYFKQLLPNSTVFDDMRYFVPGSSSCVFELKGFRIGVTICEDLWGKDPVAQAREAGAQLILSMNASPYHMGKQQQRHEVLRQRVAETGLPILYCNLVGGQDELVFDGASFAINHDGSIGFQSVHFRESLDLLRFEQGCWQGDIQAQSTCLEEEVYTALTLGVRDYLNKNSFAGAIIGLSGGIDSALTLIIAVDALGAERVRAVMMPSPYTASMSLEDSRILVERLQVRYDEIPIEAAMTIFGDMLAPQFADLPRVATDTTAENLQSRIRAMILMALSNKTGNVVLTTGNKSEMATGYATLYGDMAGGFAVLRDVFKTLVYRLAVWRNRGGEVIPRNIIDRPPSAELKPGQQDSDSLPPYVLLDAILSAYIEANESLGQIIERGYPEEDVRRVITMVRRNEYKRCQAPVGIRVTARGFGRDWRYPITSHYTDEY